MFDIGVLCHCPKRLSLPFCDVRHPVCHPTGDLQSSKSTAHGDL